MTTLQEVKLALKSGDRQSAAALLRRVLETDPSADAWYLAARLSADREQMLKCLHRALELDPNHDQSLKAIHRFEKLTPSPNADLAAVEQPQASQLETTPSEVVLDDKQSLSERANGPVSPLTIGLGLAAVLVLLLLAFIVGYLAGRNSVPVEIPTAPALALNVDASPIAPPTSEPEIADNCDLDAWESQVGDSLVDFLDAAEIALTAPRMSITPIIRDMQSASRAFERTDSPECASGIRGSLITAMDTAIDAMQAWASSDDEEATQLLIAATNNFYDVAEEISLLTPSFADQRLTEPELVWGEDLRGTTGATGSEVADKGTPAATRTPSVGSRENPIREGYVAVLPDWGEIGVIDIVRPANDIVAEENMFNDPPRSGYEYILVGMTATCQKQTGSCNVAWDFTYKLVGGSGSVFDEAFEVIPNDFEGEIYRGGEITGWLLFEIPRTERNLMLRLESIGYNDVFLTVPSQ